MSPLHSADTLALDRSRNPSSWTLSSPPPPLPRLTKIAVPPLDHNHAIASSSVSSPSARDSDCSADVDELLDGIDRVRIDDLWTTPRATDLVTRDAAPFRAGLFAPPDKKGAIAAIAPPLENRFHSSRPHPPHTHATMAMPTHLIPSANSAQLDSQSSAHHPADVQFPRLFKVYPCQTRQACIARGDSAECFYYHSVDTDRRRPNVSVYKPHMCRFIDDPAGCRKGDRCPFSHNDFERRYHPDRFGKETCRDFLRGDCPRRYCTFRHHVSSKVELALSQIDAMNDKELLQLVLKISDPRGRALCEKLLRRFGHGKKHSGWKLEGFFPHGREDQKVKYVTARVEEVKRALKATGEKKWAASLKTSSLRDMMSGVRKVAEEIRERCRSDDSYVESGSEIHRLIRAVFSNTNWSCHSQEGDNPFLVTPENQNDAMTALEKLITIMLAKTKENVTHSATRNEVPAVSALTKQSEITKHAITTNLAAQPSQQQSTLWAYPNSVASQLAA